MKPRAKLAYSSRKYRRLVEWIAYNFSPGDDETVEILAESMIVHLVADCFDLKTSQVAVDVWTIRHPELKGD